MKKVNYDVGGMLPPQAIDLEESVLGAVILDYSVMYKIAPDISENLFYKDQNQQIANAALEMFRDGEKIDLLTITDKLRRKGVLEAVGGAYYVTKLISRLTSADNVEFHVAILKERALKRSLIRIASESMPECYDETSDGFAIAQKMSTNIDKAVNNVINYKVKSIGKVHQDLILRALKALETGVKVGVPTDLLLLDNLTNGFQNTDFIVIAARPAMGKTSLALKLALNPAINHNIPVAIFSLEMSMEQLVGRAQGMLSGVSISRIIKWQTDYQEIDAIDKAARALNNAPVYIDDTPNLSLIELKAKARRLKNENGVQMILIDYLQLMKSGIDTKGSREQEISTISRGLKALAKELGIPVIALSQLSRKVEERTDKRPVLSDLRESGSIEQDADMVMFCFRPEYYGVEYYEVGGVEMNTDELFMLLVAKHRNGGLGELPLRFLKELTNIDNHPMFMGSYSGNTTSKPVALPPTTKGTNTGGYAEVVSSDEFFGANRPVRDNFEDAQEEEQDEEDAPF